MFKKILSIIIFVLVFPVTGWCVATNYYISTTGNNGNNGSISSPWLTIDHARDVIRTAKTGGNTGPFTVYLRGGKYYISSTITFDYRDNGTSGSPVTYQSYPNETAEIIGGTVLTGFSVNGSLATLHIDDVEKNGWNFRTLYIDGIRQTRARFPNASITDPHRGGFLYAASGSNSSATSFYYNTGEIPTITSTTGVEVHIFPSVESTRSFMEITDLSSINTGTRQVTISGSEAGYGIVQYDRYFLENSIQFLDAVGEWFLNTTTGILSLYVDGSFTEQSVVIAPRVSTIFSFNGTSGSRISYIQIKNITFNSTDYTRSDGCQWNSSCTTANLYFTYASNCLVQECQFYNIGKAAVRFAFGSTNTVTKNTIYDTAEGAILIYHSDSNQITNNTIHDCGKAYKSVSGVTITGNGSSTSNSNTVSHNYIYDMVRYGISLKEAGTSNVISYNKILNTNLETYDTGGIESYQLTGYNCGSTIDHNIIGDTIGYSYNGSAIYQSWGIYLDGYSAGYTLTNNVIYRAHDGGIRMARGGYNTATNNILVAGDNDWYGMYIAAYETSVNRTFKHNIIYYANHRNDAMCVGALTAGMLTSDYNIFHVPGYSPTLMEKTGSFSFATWQTRGYDAHSITTDPMFVSIATDNYTLGAGSPAFALGFVQIDTSTIGIEKYTPAPTPTPTPVSTLAPATHLRITN